MKTISFLLFLFFLSFPVRAEEEPVASKSEARLVALTGDEDYADEESAWDHTYSRNDYVFGKEPADFLRKNIDMLPKGKALDIAMGEGRNTVFLAKKGFVAEGVDISAIGIHKAQVLAKENHVRITTVNADLNHYKIRQNTYAVILDFYYLQRNLIPQIKAGLKHGGIIVFETFTRDQLKNAGNMGWEKEFLLEPGELKRNFANFEILYYAETNDGKNAIASLIARRP